uniref:DUF4828 domain-containing protein n=1 Tax=Loigolactobacillus rennini TaxID=238013 RepID=A0A1K2I4Z6_9LACO|nr:hypothetical protein LREN565_0566 [Loigolactobacillus rennini]
MIKKLISFGQKLISHKWDWSKLKQQPKTPQQTDLAKLYVGSWLFYDAKQARKHQLQISDDLAISIDDHPLAGSVIALTSQQLLFLDQYGYQLKITLAYQQPYEIYDEADHRTYPIKQKNK